MSKVGIYYAYWTHDWDVDFVPYVVTAARLGFDILEVNSGTVTNMSHAQRDRLKGAASDYNIELTYCIGLTAQYDVASPDAAVRRNGIEFLKRSAEMVQSMGGRTLGGIIYGAWPGKLPADVTDKRPYVDRSVESMREVVQTAADCGAVFHVEAVNRFEQYIMNTAAEAVEYVTRVGSSHCRVLLDAFHLNIEEDSIHDAIVATGDQLGHFHIGETNRRAPGRGRMPWDEIAGALKEIHYDGAVTMEPFLMPGGEVGRDISVFRDLRDGLDLDEEAGRALEFVRGLLE